MALRGFDSPGVRDPSGSSEQTMVAQNELGRMFKRGATSGTASNVKIEETERTTRLIGYGWAVYAIRFKETGETVYFSGWYGYSPSTSCQISKMGLRSCDRTVDASPSTSGRYGSSGPISELEDVEKVRSLA